MASSNQPHIEVALTGMLEIAEKRIPNDAGCDRGPDVQ
jgi:hypothetical protein